MKSKKLLSIFNDVNEKYIEEACPAPITAKPQKTIWLKWASIAACFFVLALSAAILPNMLYNNAPAALNKIAPAADSPNGMRKFLNYNNNRYAFLENGAKYDLSADDLSAVLGTIEHDIEANPQENAKKDFAATFAIGGTVYQMPAYDTLFRLAVEENGNYYICERVDSVDDTGINVAEYFTLATFPSSIKEIFINDHIGANVLKTLEKSKINLFIETLKTATPASLTNDDYENIGKAQNSGNSYLISFELKDNTSYKIYVLPTLSLVMIGDNRYDLPKEFTAEFASLFEGLSQKPAPMQ